MSFAPAPLVDVIIPVHTPARPVDRAVGSVLAGGLAAGDRGGVHITVVCHNVGTAPIRDRLAPAHRPLVELVECSDGTTNPAAPRNLGLERSRARYVSFVDSDDTLTPGALAAWTTTAERHGSAAVLPRLVKDSGRLVRTPVPRPLRRADLDPIKDRLAYRTHVFGLLRREPLVERGVRFNGRYATGEDQELVARAWFGGGRIDLAPRGADYVLRAGAVDRISAAPRPLGDDLAAATDLLGGSWYARLPLRQRTAIAAKILRVQVFGTVRARTAAGQWSPEDAQHVGVVLALVGSRAPRALTVLSRADREVLDATLRPGTTAGAILRLDDARRRFGRPATLLPRDPRQVLHREAPLRFMAASLLV